MRAFTLKSALLAGFCFAVLPAWAQSEDPKAAIADLDARLTKLGTPKVEGQEKAGDKQVPGLFFGPRKLNNNYDIVDDLKKRSGATATIFVKSGDDFVRISTNVLTPEGKRGVGTPLARAKAYESVSKGQNYCGEVDVLGTAFNACYNAVKDDKGAVIGATYVGFKKS